MSDQDKPGVGIHEPPPPPRPALAHIIKSFAAAAVAFDLATVIVLWLGRFNLATLLASFALLFGGITFVLLLRMPSDQVRPSVGDRAQPPR